MKIESRDLKVDELFTSSYFFIPRFQRPYSWEEENILEFWNDINNIIGQNYFIGSMVVYECDKNTVGIVDGQQRITTITILLCVIRDAFKAIGDDDKAQGLQQYIERKTRENKSKFVLQTETSFPYLQEHILNYSDPQLDCPTGEEEKAIELAEKIFKDKVDSNLKKIQDSTAISTGVNEAKIDWLVNLRDTVLDLSIILISLDNEEDAYLIFETLNTRGKDLALSDLLKNLFVKNIKNTGDVDHAKIKWKKVLETISESETAINSDNFIAHSWSSRYESITLKQAYPKIKQAITPKNVKAHLLAFEKDAEYYRSIFEPRFSWAKDQQEAASSLEALRLFKIAQPAPALLSLVRAFHDNKIKLGKLVIALQAIENFHFAFTAVTSSRSSGGISGMYSSFGRKLYDAESSDRAGNEIRELISKLRDRRPGISEFTANFEGILYTKTNTKQRGLVRYILLRLQHAERITHSGKDSSLTIEHIYPQSKINKTFNEGIVGQIGNLLLVDEDTNNKLKDKSFADKKSILIERGYKLPSCFSNSDEITPELILDSTRSRAALAFEEVWRI